ncbi:MAG TPA: hypothetical protein VK419_06420 [Bryobacteraceae bacterium]|nr:hypothetical protein [Bryobacteraceae bacterium]
MRASALALGFATLASFSIASLSFAATTTTWEMTGSQDFLRGRLNGLSLTRDGRLVVGPKMETVFSSDQPEIWSVAQAPDGSLYLGTGNRGRLYRVDPSGKSELVWSADQPEIFAVAVDSKGVAYAGTSPDGKVYRIENGKAAEYFSPGAKYIWALKVAPDGSLFVATGDQGKIFRVTPEGRGEVYYDTGQTHVTCLAFDREGRLLAGSDPNGILYRISAPNKAFVLYGANLPEIRAIVPAADGSIYASALGGSVARRIGAASNPANGTTPAVVAPATSITVTDAQGGLNPAPKIEAPKPAPTTPPAAVPVTASVVEYSGVDKSALYKINPDNTVETLWSSKDENAYDLAVSGGDLLFVTDQRGRIYRLDRERKTTLVAQANEGEATRLLETQTGLIAATADLGKILKLTTASASAGTFESPVHDSGSVARWGRIMWRGDGASFQTRTGNSSRPDATWSDWSAPITDLAHSNITSPNARYIQWRAELSASSARPDAAIDGVTIAYLPQNSPPMVRSVNVTMQAGTAKAASSSSNSASASYSVTVTDSGDSSTPAGTQAQTLSRAAGQQIQISWQADDPDGDRLIYNLYFRGEDEHDWKLLRANMTENTYLLDGDVLADGRYYFKVTASDRPSNPAEYARDAELVSAPVLIDNTPPVVTAGAPRRNGSAIEIDVEAEDRGSVLRRCEYSIDAGPWSPVEAADGVTDSAREQFHIRIPDLAAGEHLIVIRAFDAAGNAGLTKVVVR